MRYGGLATLVMAIWSAGLGADASSDYTARPHASRQRATCGLGEQVLKEWLAGQSGSARFVDDSPPAVQPAPVGTPPDLAAAWSGKPPANLFEACPGLRAEVGRLGGFATERERTAVDGLGGPWLEVLRFSAPVLDATGRYGLVAIELRCPGLCGTRGVSLYQRRGKRWVNVKTAPWPIS